MRMYGVLSEVADLRETVRLLHRAGGRERTRLSTRVAEDLGALGLVLMGLVGLLVEKGILTRDELLAQLRRVDELDGVADGKVTPEQLRVALGIAPADPGPPPAPVSMRRRR
jgi:uncharacterized protein YceH (UPF0502 family)